MRWPTPSRSQIFQRALRETDRARPLADPVGIVEQHDGLAALRQIDRQRQPDRPGADHHDGMMRRVAASPILIGVTMVTELDFGRLRHALTWLLANGRDAGYDSLTCNYLNAVPVRPSTQIGAIFVKRAFERSGRPGRVRTTRLEKGSKLDLFRFVPFRLNRLAAEVSSALSVEYQARYGLDIPEWRVLATLGFRNDACSAQYIAHCTRTHKSTISRAVTALMARQLVERVENADDRREFALRMTRKGKRCTRN